MVWIIILRTIPISLRLSDTSPLLSSSAAKGTVLSLFSMFKNKVCNNDRCNDKLSDPCILLHEMFGIADIADDRMDLSSVTGVNRRKFADKPL